MAKMVLYGGEKDGYGLNGELDIKSHPQVFYAVPNHDEERIKRTAGKQAKIEMRNKLSVLAYEFDPERSTYDRFIMVRNPELDKVSH